MRHGGLPNCIVEKIGPQQNCDEDKRNHRGPDGEVLKDLLQVVKTEKQIKKCSQTSE